jgi:molybdenum cofactor synthesis domain-containing protein
MGLLCRAGMSEKNKAGEAPTPPHFAPQHTIRTAFVKRICNIFSILLGTRPLLDMPFSAAILTISDKGARGERLDTSGDAIREMLSSLEVSVDRYEVIPDDRASITERLIAWADGGGLDLIVTTGGTGLGPRDVTPQATRDALDYEAPGLAEAMRLEGMKHTPMAMLSRAVAGVRGRTLIVNLPGSPRGVRESLSVLLPVLPHALELLRGQTEHPD